MATKKKEEVQENSGVIIAKGLQDIGCLAEDRFPVELSRRDRKIILNLKPVTMEIAEKVRNAFPMPDPPHKVFNQEEQLRRKMDKLPLNVPDYEDEGYQKAVGEISIRIEWGILRAALGFDEDPIVGLDEWIVEAKKVFLPGDYIDILSAVNKGNDIGKMVDTVSPS